MLLVTAGSGFGGGRTAWDISFAQYDGISFGSSAEDTTPLGLAFKTDGTKMYIAGNANDSIYQYSLSTAWDLSTASYSGISFGASSEGTTPRGPAFKTDGTKMYIINGPIDRGVFQYSLSTAWASSTTSYDGISFNASSEDTSPLALAFKTDGTKMYIAGETNRKIFQYSLSTAWASSTTSYDGISFATLSEDTEINSLTFNLDGSKMYLLGNGNDRVFQYSLSTAWDLSTASYSGISFGSSAEDTTPLGLAFKTDGTKMYIAGNANDSIYQYAL